LEPQCSFRDLSNGFGGSWDEALLNKGTGFELYLKHI